MACICSSRLLAESLASEKLFLHTLQGMLDTAHMAFAGMSH